MFSNSCCTALNAGTLTLPSTHPGQDSARTRVARGQLGFLSHLGRSTASRCPVRHFSQGLPPTPTAAGWPLSALGTWIKAGEAAGPWPCAAWVGAPPPRPSACADSANPNPPPAPRPPLPLPQVGLGLFWSGRSQGSQLTKHEYKDKFWS